MSNDTPIDPHSGEERDEHIEEERAQLREESAALMRRCLTNDPPTHEEMRLFSERVAEFGSKVRPPGSTLFGIPGDTDVGDDGAAALAETGEEKLAGGGWFWGTEESVPAATRCYDSREELVEALEAKGWAVFLGSDGKRVLGAPKGTPTRDGCPCCSGVQGVRFEGEALILTGGCTISASSAVWGDGPWEDRGYVLEHQGIEPDLDGIIVVTDEIPTPQEAEELVKRAAVRP